MLKRHDRFFQLFFIFSVIFSCSSLSSYEASKFHPGHDRILLIIGQDNDSIAGYVNEGSFPEPAGVVFYTSLTMSSALRGLYNDENYGAGRLNASELLSKYQNSVLVIGLYVVGALDDIVSGKLDRKLDELGRFIEEADRPVFLRFGYEFEGPWNAYDSASYVQAFRYTRNRLAKITDNFAMVWQAAASPWGTYERYSSYYKLLEAYYPGDAYVDWCGFSVFAVNSRAFPELVSLDIAERQREAILDFARAHAKPVMICEATPQGYDIEGKTRSAIVPVYYKGRHYNPGDVIEKKSSEDIWQEWFVPFLNFIKRNRDIIKAVVYINADWNKQPMWAHPYRNGYWGDSRIQVDEYIASMWQNEIESGMWVNSDKGLFEYLGYQK
ncbi:glycosyl hydrolase [Spirochaetia bacterium 38H-sp]|uniref:Glycosyl hydrolase n=1 Tax=Rarispira pelagica TaxID=3141764 RepID=A0ABU9UAC0_9SPIR